MPLASQLPRKRTTSTSISVTSPRSSTILGPLLSSCACKISRCSVVSQFDLQPLEFVGSKFQTEELPFSAPLGEHRHEFAKPPESSNCGETNASLAANVDSPDRESQSEDRYGAIAR